jgi:peptide/nickel transport system ATP-binding protein
MRNDLTVAENIAEPVLSRDRQFDRRALGRAAALLIDAVDLELGVLNRFPYELSRGQRQRVAFARALIVEPRLLIVDEPAQGVDVIARPALFELLERLNRGRTLSMVVISNDLATIERLTSRVLVTNRGTVIARGEIDRVLRDPFDSYLRRMRDAREFARAPLPGLVDRELVAAAERVAGGLFLEEDPEQVAAAERERLLEERPEFARFHTPAGENPTQSNEETRK